MQHLIFRRTLRILKSPSIDQNCIFLKSFNFKSFSYFAVKGCEQTRRIRLENPPQSMQVELKVVNRLRGPHLGSPDLDTHSINGSLHGRYLRIGTWGIP